MGRRFESCRAHQVFLSAWLVATSRLMDSQFPRVESSLKSPSHSLATENLSIAKRILGKNIQAAL
jgi:hypothetical protein